MYIDQIDIEGKKRNDRTHMRQKAISKRSEPPSPTGAERPRQCKIGRATEGPQKNIFASIFRGEPTVIPNVANPDRTTTNS